MAFQPQLTLLRYFLGLSPSSTWSTDDDVIFVAIDFENGRNIIEKFPRRYDCQVGISILDTRDLASSPDTAITTHNFISGSRKYCVAKSQRFCFGNSVTIYPQDILKTIESLFSRKRKIILVGHDIKNEIKVLVSLGFDLDTSIVGYLDTQVMAMELLGLSNNHGLSLKCLIQCFGRPHGYSPSMLHNAGNDANFTLRVLLLLAETSLSSVPMITPVQFWKSHAIWAIAQSPVPFNDILPMAHRGCRGGVKFKKQSSPTPLTDCEIKCKGANWVGYFVLSGDFGASRQLQIRLISEDTSSGKYAKIERQIRAEWQQRSMAKNKDIFLDISDSDYWYMAESEGSSIGGTAEYFRKLPLDEITLTTTDSGIVADLKYFISTC